MISAHDQSNSNRFGAWRVNGRNYANKLAAVLDAVKTGHWIHWDFNESIFNQYDWTKEPSVSLDTLYGLRAKQLRARYEHIAVEFSGGADSWNLLYHFCKQGLHVDKVIHRYAAETVKTSNDLSAQNLWAEGKFQAWPSYQRLLELNPKLTWHTWNVVEPIMDGWAGANIDLMIHNNLHPGAILKSPDQTNYNPFGIPDIPTSAMVYGVDKPQVEFRDGKFYLVFYDFQVILRSVLERQAMGAGMQDIFFYWDPDCVDMMAKQAHLIMNWFRQHQSMLPLMTQKKHYMAIVNRLIYPDYQPIWQSDKARGLFAQTHESWFIDNQDLKGSRQWHNIMMDFTNILESSLKDSPYVQYLLKDNESHPRYKVLAACPSQAYYLGDL